MEYNFGEVEKKWQKQWAAEKVFKTEIVEGKPKYYVLDMFPYPSGAGLHVGHPLGYIASDIFSRYKRLKGFNVLHPMGYDAYGLPAEQYAIQTGTHPAITTEINLARYREQLDKIGFSFDWDREVRTSDPDYYKWTQWTFIQLFNSWFNKETNKAESISELISVFETIGNASVDAACNETEVFSSVAWNAMSEKQRQEILMNYRLAYLAETAVNWCPALGTVLANDEVSEGHSVRGGHLVERKKMKQWLLRITAYADRLLAGLNTIDWTESIKEIQRNWIGRSEGGSMKFRVINLPLTPSVNGEVLPTGDLGGVLNTGESKNLPLTPSVGGGTLGDTDSSLMEDNITRTKGYLTTDPYTFSLLKERAKEMRKEQTEAEKIIWKKLRKNQIKHKIRRQQIIDNYIVDFVCLPKKTIIEIDGPIHNFQKEADEKRTRYLNSVGYDIIRFKNEDVLADPEKIAQEIAAFLDMKVLPTEENLGEVLPIGEDLGVVLNAGESNNLPLTPSVGGGTQGGIDSIEKEENATFTQGYITTNYYTFNLLKERSKEMRKNLTEAEKIIWEKLRKNQIKHKIRRQQIIDNYIVDFVCLPKKTIIEIDGPIHNFQKEADEKRTRYLNSVGYDIIRFKNEDVLADPDKIAKEIADFLDRKVLPTEENFGEVLPIGEDLGGVLTFGKSKNLPLTPSVEGGTPDEIESFEIEVFTTRPDTIFGATFMVLAPEHELVSKITTSEYHEKIDAYVSWAKNRTERERMTEVKKVSGEFTGAYAINPFTSQPIPIWIADYVLMGYGTGAIMAVPAHDSRDFAFARHFNLPIVQVVNKPGHEATDPAIWEESYDSKDGVMINSGFIDGMHVKQAISAVIHETEKRGIGTGKINFRLRDAIFSRQRYWGEPFPVYYKDGMPYTLHEDQLPLLLPEVDAYLPTENGEPPLARAKNWVTSDGYPLETNTMPGFAGSSGYYLRYMDPRNDKEYFSKEAANYWQSVDLYIGGAEHATGHLLYSRFWNKFLFDLGYSVVEEPFKKLINQGMIQGRSSFVYRVKGTNTFVSYNLRQQYDVQQLHVDVNIVENDILDTDKFREWRPDFAEAEFILEDGKYHCGWEVEKMSKSMHNVVNPDILIERYGADTLRLYEMFLGPLEQAKPWDTSGIEGVFRFIRKFWRLFNDSENNFHVTNEAPTAAELKILHKTIKKIQDDTERISFNTAVSSFMICVNELTELKCNKRAILNELVILVSPYAPHLAEELWQLLGNKENVCNASFPEFNAAFTVDDTFSYPVSFNGKTRFTLELPIDTAIAEIEKAVLESPEAQKWLGGQSPKKVIIVPKKIVNIVI